MFLSDAQLLLLLTQKEPIVTDLDVGEGEQSYTKDAPVQPCSVDLSVGNIYVPGATEGEQGSKERPRKAFTLETGMTAMIETQEECRLPDWIGAIGFPPNEVSSHGLLMTNPGHVDPGYAGTMRFTVINMGKSDYDLVRGERIVSLLFFTLAPPAQKDYTERPDGKHQSPTALADLSPDFLSVNERVERAVAKQEQKTRRIALAAPIIVGLLAILATVIASLLIFQGDIRELKARSSTLGDVRGLEQRVQSLEQTLKHERAQASLEASGGQ